MADAITLNRAGPGMHGLVHTNLSLMPEPFLGITKVQIHGDAPDAGLSDAMGGPVPGPGKSVAFGRVECAWLAPGEWLLIGEETSVEALASRIEELPDVLLLVTSLTHARASFMVSGAQARDVLAGHCPLDLSKSNFVPGDVARSLLGETGLFLHRLDDRDNAPQFRVIVDQTMADYAVRMLTGSDGKL